MATLVWLATNCWITMHFLLQFLLVRIDSKKKFSGTYKTDFHNDRSLADFMHRSFFWMNWSRKMTGETGQRRGLCKQTDGTSCLFGDYN